MLDEVNRCMEPAELLPQVYAELRKIAAARMAEERVGHTLDATALVHEVYLKLGGERSFASRADYLKAASQAMRRILVDHARARRAQKRGGGNRIDLESHHIAVDSVDDRLEALDESLGLLALERPAVAELVQLKYFGGLNLADCAAVLNISERTADIWWSYARAWLAVQLQK